MSVVSVTNIRNDREQIMLNFPCNQKKGIYSSQHEFLMVDHRAWNMQLREMVSANLFLCLFARWTLAPVGDWRVCSGLE